MAIKTDLSKIPSISGLNGYSLRCPEVKLNGHDSYCSYTVCQHTILAFKEKRLPASSFTSSGKCQALKMMVEEIRQGESLYFVDMPALIEEVEERNRTARTLQPKRGSASIYSGIKGKRQSSTVAETGRLPDASEIYSELIKETLKEKTD
ncbi:hypothetical protein [Klebsiella pneumoniae]|uniref:hypothetical protein n=1 Tax=Klebsiella pneumoniae TaxID=573 RepID=UPI003EE3CAD5